MKYSVDIERSLVALAVCFKRVGNIVNAFDWNVRVNAGGIDYGIYFNFDIDKKELEISNEQKYDSVLCLNDIIDLIDKNALGLDETEN